jgi:hypothetical protein
MLDLNVGDLSFSAQLLQVHIMLDLSLGGRTADHVVLLLSCLLHLVLLLRDLPVLAQPFLVLFLFPLNVLFMLATPALRSRNV